MIVGRGDENFVFKPDTGKVLVDELVAVSREVLTHIGASSNWHQ